jgi:hypothetical protein
MLSEMLSDEGPDGNMFDERELLSSSVCSAFEAVSLRFLSCRMYTRQEGVRTLLASPGPGTPEASCLKQLQHVGNGLRPVLSAARHPPHCGRSHANELRPRPSSGRIGIVHITTNELDTLPSVVAAIAIIGAFLGVSSTNRSQSRLARGSYERDRLAETYIDLLKGVHHRNAQLDDTYGRPINKAPRTPAKYEVDLTSNDETLFGARLMAYASPKINELWGEFALLTTEFDNYMIGLRTSTGVPPAELGGARRQELEKKFGGWRRMRDELTTLIRHELK